MIQKIYMKIATSIIIKQSNKGDTSQDVSLDTWIQHFKSLLNMDYADNFLRNDIFNCFGLNNSPLNGSITIDEIRKSINSLKNVKSSGPDGISNKMLKISSQFFIEEFVVLFYFILKSGVYPDAWRDDLQTLRPHYHLVS